MSSRKVTANKRKYEDAFKYAKKGQWDEIDEKIRFKYYKIIRKIRKDELDQVTSKLLKEPTGQTESFTKPLALSNYPGIWYYGSSGSGKTSKILKENPSIYFKDLTKDWRGYKDEENVIIEDLQRANVQWILPFLKLWTNVQPFLVTVANGIERWIRPKQIYFTSTLPLKKLFSSGDSNIVNILEFRFTQISMDDLNKRQQRIQAIFPSQQIKKLTASQSLTKTIPIDSPQIDEIQDEQQTQEFRIEIDDVDRKINELDTNLVQQEHDDLEIKVSDDLEIQEPIKKKRKVIERKDIFGNEQVTK